MPVPLLDLSRHYKPLADQLEAAVFDVLRSGGYIGGPYQEKLETMMAELVGAKQAIAVSSGSDALLVALMALDIQAGDQVITTPFTFFATAGAIARLGATPVFVDIKPDTFNIDPVLIESAITEKTKAILPVHLYGQCADMHAINDIASRHNLPVVEDAAQAIGASRDGGRAGSMGLIGCFSFYPTKNLSGLGDGGCVTTVDEQLGEKIRILRNHGMNPRYYHHMIGGNFRLDAMQSAGLSVKLPLVPQYNDGRRKKAANYRRLFHEAGLTDSGASAGPITLPVELTEGHVYHQYIVRANQRDELIAHLRQHQVGCEIYYPLGLHQQKCFEYLGHKEGDFPQTEAAAKQTIALPIFPELTDPEQAEVVETIAKFYN